MPASRLPRAMVFDLIGTLFSLESQRPRLIACGLPGHALEPWFAAGLRDLFALALTGQTVPMRAVLADSLHRLLVQNHLRHDGPRVEAVLAGMSQLDADPQARAALARLDATGMVCAALSNGSMEASEALLARATLRPFFAQVVSIDAIGLPKPRAEAYRAMADRLALDPSDLMMVASHPWDLHGARAAGLQTAYVSHGLPWPASLTAPDFQADDLSALAARFGRDAA